MQAHAEGFRDLTLAEFVDRLGSSDPVPGGGSASAVAASLGAGLVAMVAALSEGRARYADHADLHASAGAAGRQLAKRFLDLADEDASAYAEFSKALKLPKDTDAQQAARKSAMGSAAKVAAEVPLRCVESCLELVRVAEALAGRSNVNASSDLNVAALLGEASARGAAANVIVNLPSVGDDAWAADTQVRVEELLKLVTETAAEAQRVVASGAAREPRGELFGSGASAG